jgi:hypothetical protein
MACSATTRREDFQNEPARFNAEWVSLDATALPDGDADLDYLNFAGFAAQRRRRRGARGK